MGTHYLWDPIEDNIVQEMDDAGNILVDYVTESSRFGNIVIQHRGGEPSFFHTDGQGSTLCLTDSAAAITDIYSYAAFGVKVGHVGQTVNPIRFEGMGQYLWDEVLGAYLVRRRGYDPKAGRWLSFDLINHMWQTNRFTYCRNAPAQFSDPSGEKEKDKCKLKRFQVNRDLKEPVLFSMGSQVGGEKGFYVLGFHTFAEFEDCCRCCEFRQFIRGKTEVRIDGAKWEEVSSWGHFDTQWHHGPGYTEDLSKKGLAYGHRKDENRKLSKYLAEGCKYFASDWPGIEGFAVRYLDGKTKTYEVRYWADLWLRIVDVCADEGTYERTVESKHIRIQLSLSYDNSTGEVTIPGSSFEIV